MSAPIENYLITNDDLYMMGEGDWYRSYEKLGAHPCHKDGVEGYWFAVWAPFALSVRVIGDFNDWNPTATYLSCTRTEGVWCGFVPGVVEGQLYKYIIETPQKDLLYKADPYGVSAECPPGTASRTADISAYTWGDDAYMKQRSEESFFKKPLNIFEVHLASWKRHPDGLAGNGDPDSEDHSGSYLTYDELSEDLVAYVKEMGYSHIEILPIMEHPFDGSWGYQVTGYYAPSSRYGTPVQFKHFVDACHQAGIGVILDWVPGGFCKDEHGLAHFNGNKLYEKEEHPNWGTFKFDFGRGEVRTFLISNLLYWVGEYHADGIRMDGVTSMLYLNFGVDDPRRKKFNSRGTEEDDVSIAFVRNCNDTVSKYYPDVMMIAEESTAWPLVTYPTSDGGLGFHFKWDMGWMNDTLHYMQTDFPFRPGNHKLLTFSTMYQFNENFILPLSHDEVVHGKCSLVTRMPGDYWRQFAGMRALALYQMTHAGGKLNFMGNEIAQFIEWRYYEGIQYFLTQDYESHSHHQRFVAALNHFYSEHPALWQDAYRPEGFEWIDADNSDQCIISFARHGDSEKDDLVIVINFEVNPYEEYRIGVPRPGIYEEVFNSDDLDYGGSGVTNKSVKFMTVDEPWNMRDQSIELRIPPLGGTILRYVGPIPKRRAPRTRKTGTKASTKSRTSRSRASGRATTKTATKTRTGTRNTKTTRAAEAADSTKAAKTAEKDSAESPAKKAGAAARKRVKTAAKTAAKTAKDEVETKLAGKRSSAGKKASGTARTSAKKEETDEA